MKLDRKKIFLLIVCGLIVLLVHMRYEQYRKTTTIFIPTPTDIPRAFNIDELIDKKYLPSVKDGYGLQNGNLDKEKLFGNKSILGYITEVELLPFNNNLLLIKARVQTLFDEKFYYYVKDLSTSRINFIREGYWREFSTGWLNDREFYSWRSQGTDVGELLITNINNKTTISSVDFLPENTNYGHFIKAFDEGNILVFGKFDTDEVIVYDRLADGIRLYDSLKSFEDQLFN